MNNKVFKVAHGLLIIAFVVSATFTAVSSQEVAQNQTQSQVQAQPQAQSEPEPQAQPQAQPQSEPQPQGITFKTEGIRNSKEDILNQRISLELRDIDIIESLKFLASKANMNIVYTKGVTGRVTLAVENVPIKDIFDIMLRSNGLAYIKAGEIYNIMTEAEYKALYGQGFSDSRQVKVFRLKYAVPEQAFNLLDALKSEIGRVLVDSESGNVLLLDTAERIERMQKALVEFERENSVQVFNLKYSKAKDVEEMLKSQLDAKKVGSIKADERNNQIIVQTLPERMQEIARLINSLDRQTKEVLIDTQIIKIKLTDQADRGINWEGLFNIAEGTKQGMSYLGSYPFSAVQSSTALWSSREQVLKNLNGTVGSYPFSGTYTTAGYAGSTATPPGKNMHLGMINNKKDFDVVVNYLETLGNSQILSNPKLVVVNNQEAKIHIGERQAYVTTTTTTGSSSSTISEEVQFVDVGIQLSVTPNINDDGYITMKVKPEISSVSSVLITPTNNRIPIIDTSMTETTVMIKDGTTLIIGGLRKEEKSKSSEQTPFLGQIPFLSSLFKSATIKTDRIELLVMLTPHIITGNELTTGNERVFISSPGKDYRDYQAVVPDKVLTNELPVEVRPKAYRDYFTPGSENKDKPLMKEIRYEPR
jgi:type II secretory pathway component GspD/PulD (secretin)